MRLKEKIKNAPLDPGCYLFKDNKEAIIYVGKAKVLRNRVKQYFTKANQQTEKGLILGKMICDVEYRIMDTERDALLEEYRLIKQYRPWFNVQHKVDRNNTYYLQLNTTFGYAFLEVNDKVEKCKKPLAKFKSERRAEEAIGILSRVYHTPICKNPFEKGRTPCLHYRLKQCLGPCGERISRQEYQKVVSEMSRFFKGNQTQTLKRLNADLEKYIQELEFEKAKALKDDIDELKRIGGQSASRISIPDDCDSILFFRAYREQSCALFYIKRGKIKRRCDLDGRFDEGIIDAFLESENSKEQDNVLNLTKDCLENVSADKKLLILPKNISLADMKTLVAKAWMEW